MTTVTVSVSLEGDRVGDCRSAVGKVAGIECRYIVVSVESAVLGKEFLEIRGSVGSASLDLTDSMEIACLSDPKIASVTCLFASPLPLVLECVSLSNGNFGTSGPGQAVVRMFVKQTVS